MSHHTLCFETDRSRSPHHKLNEWAGRPLPLSASLSALTARSFFDWRALQRPSERRHVISLAARRSTPIKRTPSGPAFASRHIRFSRATRRCGVWRCLQRLSACYHQRARRLIEWNGALSMVAHPSIRPNTYVPARKQAGGHATFILLAAVIAQTRCVHAALSTESPRFIYGLKECSLTRVNIFNRGRLYPDIFRAGRRTHENAARRFHQRHARRQGSRGDGALVRALWLLHSHLPYLSAAGR